MQEPSFFLYAEHSIQDIAFRALSTHPRLAAYRDVVPLLQRKVQLTEVELAKPDMTDPAVEEFVSSIPPHLLLPFAEMDAKLTDIKWRARRAMSVLLLDVLFEHGGVRAGDKFDDVLQRFRANELTKEQVQALLNDSCLWPSLTTHPTNPCSLAYTKAGIRVECLVGYPDSKKEELEDAVMELLAAPMDETWDATGRARKTTVMESEELITILNIQYRSLHRPLKRLMRALHENGYDGVEPRTLLDIHVWGPGDGDGNPNATKTALSHFLRMLTVACTSAHLAELKRPGGLLELCQGPEGEAVKTETLRLVRALESLRDCREGLMQQNSVICDVAFVALYDAAKERKPELLVPFPNGYAPKAPASPLWALWQRYRTFGSGRFAHVDVRHNSRDIMATAACLLSLVDNITVNEFMSASDVTQASIIRSRLEDPSMPARVREVIKTDDAKELLKVQGFPQKTLETAARVFSRMLVIGAHNGRFQKFIIAETSSVANVLAALLLLQCAGVPVMQPKSPIDIVPLFESRADLLAAPTMVHELLLDRAFSKNVLGRGYLLAMVAKSDTARLSGPGVQGIQEETIGQLLTMNPANYKGARVFVMLGGGDDQMRGGGRIVESPHVVLRAEAREGGSFPARIAMTIQGMQLQLLLGSPLLSRYFIEGFSSQLLLSNARVQGLVPWRKAADATNATAAARQVHSYFNRAMDNYERLVGTVAKQDPVRHAIVDYLNCFPSQIIEWTNKSSRPGARKKTMDPLQGRAISLDQRAKHDGGYVTATIGLADALQNLSQSLRCGFPTAPLPPSAVSITGMIQTVQSDEASLVTPAVSRSQQGLIMEAHRHAYAGSKPFRDHIRMMATVLYQKDYEFAWSIRGGTPTYLERSQLESAYVQDTYNPPRVFLAWMEAQDGKLAYLITTAITGVQPISLVSLKEPLRLGWPDLAKHLDLRCRQSLIAKRLELKAIRRIHNYAAAVNNSASFSAIGAAPIDKKNESELVIPEDLRRLAYFAYVGRNPACSSPNFSLTMTDPLKEDGKDRLSEHNPRILGKLPKLSWGLKEEGRDTSKL